MPEGPAGTIPHGMGDFRVGHPRLESKAAQPTGIEEVPFSRIAFDDRSAPDIIIGIGKPGRGRDRLDERGEIEVGVGNEPVVLHGWKSG